MTTSHIIYLLFAFSLGGLVSFIIWGWAYHQHKKAWQLEYRRLMTGINRVRSELCKNIYDRTQFSVENPNHFLEYINQMLLKIENDEPNWPRG